MPLSSESHKRSTVSLPREEHEQVIAEARQVWPGEKSEARLLRNALVAWALDRRGQGQQQHPQAPDGGIDAERVDSLERRVAGVEASIDKGAEDRGAKPLCERVLRLEDFLSSRHRFRK